MHPVYLFIGQSGCGKGTQINLLKEHLFKADPATKFFYIETGQKFREFIKEDTFTAQRTHELINEGKLPAAFLGVHMWAHQLMQEYDGQATVLIDGTPRVPEEVPLLLSAAVFYGWTIDVIYLQVGDEWSYKRIKERSREDDKHEVGIAERIGWFHACVEPAIEILKESPLVRFHGVQGEASIEQVHKDVCDALGVL
jgi:adenylate kinase family enzyme